MFSSIVSGNTRVRYAVTWKTSLELSQERMSNLTACHAVQCMQEAHAMDVMLRGHERACIEGSPVQPLATGNEAMYLGSYA